MMEDPEEHEQLHLTNYSARSNSFAESLHLRSSSTFTDVVPCEERI